MDASQYAERMARELATFADQAVVHDLPPIAHYYAGKHIAPILQAHGYFDAPDFFVKNIVAQAGRGRTVTVVSYGAGNAEVELDVARRLTAGGVGAFHFDCIDVNPDMLERARAAAQSAGLGRHFTFVRADITGPSPSRATYDVHIAHQSLHHVVDLEGLYGAIERAMTETSVFLASDMIGRNGHMRWPETLVVVEKLWRCLLSKHRYSRQLGRTDDTFVNFDCSDVGFEGIRAQDVLPLLADRFAFEELMSWGGIVDPFVDRSYGPNFDATSVEDRRFIDYVCELERALTRAGIVKPTQMLARMRRRDVPGPTVDVAPFVRRGPPPSMPDLSRIEFEFARHEELISHVMAGDADAPFLGEGFHAFEPENGIRWTARVFTLRFDLPQEAAPFRCTVALDVLSPALPKPGGVSFYANGVRIGRLESVYAHLAPDPRLLIEFETFGGPSQVTVALDHPQHPPGAAEPRELGLVVTRLAVTMVRV